MRSQLCRIPTLPCYTNCYERVNILGIPLRMSKTSPEFFKTSEVYLWKIEGWSRIQNSSAPHSKAKYCLPAYPWYSVQKVKYRKERSQILVFSSPQFPLKLSVVSEHAILVPYQ